MVLILGAKIRKCFGCKNITIYSTELLSTSIIVTYLKSSYVSNNGQVWNNILKNTNRLCLDRNAQQRRFLI